MQRLRSMAFESESEEEDDFLVIRRPRWIRERNEHFCNFDDTDFKIRFRLSKAAAYELLVKIEDHLEYISERNQSISPINQLLATLRFYATNSTQMTVGDFSGLSTSTAQRIIHKVSAAIASLHRHYIQFPESRQELKREQNNFYRIARFPRAIGAMDCTHVRISTPGGDQAELYRNRKGYFSLNVQTICNANMEIIDIVARWPGSTHDSTIFNNCYRKAKFESGCYGDAVLLVDGGYASTSYTMPPLENPSTPAEQLYNESQIRSRNPVERSYGIWKRRFPALALGLRIKLDKALVVIVATAVLHNLLRRQGEEVPPDDPELELPDTWEVLLRNGQMENGSSSMSRRNRTRDLLINSYFRNLL